MFTFPSDSNAKAGAVKSVNAGNNFVVPVQMQADDGITPIDSAHQFPVIADLKTGANIIGKVGIDQTTPGTTNKVVAAIDQSTPGTTNKVVAELSGSNIPDTTPAPVKQIKKRTITTIANAVSVAAGGNTGSLALGADGTEDEVWALINIDKQPWSANYRGLVGLHGSSHLIGYPVYNSTTALYSSGVLPALAYIIGWAPSLQGLTAPTSLAEAKQYKIPLASDMTITITNNHATDTATITVRIMRIWR